MLYFLIKLPVRLALAIFCRRIIARSPVGFGLDGPLLITANHPNSFLDAVIIGSRFSRPVHFLARGDAFRKPWHNTLLRLLNMIPVYRLSEGKDNLHRNGDAFERCKEILSQNGIVLIFIEGISVNSHELQPFKKGAARIAIENSHLENFRTLPLGIAYSSLDRLGKTICIETVAAIPVQTLLPYEEEARNMRYFNEHLFGEIKGLVNIPSQNDQGKSKTKWVLLLPAFLGYLLHYPFYSLISNLVYQKTKGTIFYDSVLFGVLLILYPLYVLILCLAIGLFNVPFLLLISIFLLHPLMAWAAVRFFK